MYNAYYDIPMLLGFMGSIVRSYCAFGLCSTLPSMLLGRGGGG